MSTTETLTRALIGCVDTRALERSIVNELKNSYSQDEITSQLKRAAELLGVEAETPEQAIRMDITHEELAALRMARDVLARL